MEYVVGPILALLVGMKFSVYKAKKAEDSLKSLEAKVETIVARIDQTDKEMPKRLMATITPVAVAVKKLNEQVGL